MRSVENGARGGGTVGPSSDRGLPSRVVPIDPGVVELRSWIVEVDRTGERAGAARETPPRTHPESTWPSVVAHAAPGASATTAAGRHRGRVSYRDSVREAPVVAVPPVRPIPARNTAAGRNSSPPRAVTTSWCVRPYTTAAMPAERASAAARQYRQSRSETAKRSNPDCRIPPGSDSTRIPVQLDIDNSDRSTRPSLSAGVRGGPYCLAHPAASQGAPGWEG